MGTYIDEPNSSSKRRVVIVGGGVAGLEAALALADLASDVAEISLVASDPEFVLKPLSVEEPFTKVPAARMELAPLLAKIGVEYVAGAVESVSPMRQSIELGARGATAGRSLAYDYLVVCTGARAQPAYDKAETFWSSSGELPIDDMIRNAAASPSKTLALVVPPGTSWPLPLYELALLTRRRSEKLGLSDLELALYTPEDSPLLIFGRPASEAVADVLRARRISATLEATVVESDAGLRVVPEGMPIDAEIVLALPQLVGAVIDGLPVDDHGFIPIDECARVIGAASVYAAGDGTNFPVKQGGLATQQADCAAEQIAACLGVDIEPTPFSPVLRGQLITGDESLNLAHELTGGHGEGVASLDYLWWPPEKISGRYLSSLLGHEVGRDPLERPFPTLDVEVTVGHDWHRALRSRESGVRSI